MCGRKKPHDKCPFCACTANVLLKIAEASYIWYLTRAQHAFVRHCKRFMSPVGTSETGAAIQMHNCEVKNREADLHILGLFIRFEKKDL